MIQSTGTDQEDPGGIDEPSSLSAVSSSQHTSESSDNDQPDPPIAESKAGGTHHTSRSIVASIASTIDVIISGLIRAHGKIEVSVPLFCEYVQKSTSASRATIVSITRYTATTGIPHLFLLLEVNRTRKRTMWLRLDRRAELKDFKTYADFVAHGFSGPAGDQVTVSTDPDTLLKISPCALESKLEFKSPPTLGHLKQLLGVLFEKSSLYKLWPENCYFFCSVVQEHFARWCDGVFNHGNLNHSDIAPEIRSEIRSHMAVYYGLKGAISLMSEIEGLYETVITDEREQEQRRSHAKMIRSVLESLFSERSQRLDFSRSVERFSRDILHCEEHLKKLKKTGWTTRFRAPPSSVIDVQILENVTKVIDSAFMSFKFRDQATQNVTLDLKGVQPWIVSSGVLSDVRVGSNSSVASPCLEGTRIELLDELFDWAMERKLSEFRIAWLNGPSGIGKTSIAQSVVQGLHAVGNLAAQFFFSRDDVYRRDPEAVFPSIAHQLAQFSPEFGQHLEAVKALPIAKDTSVAMQLKTLLVEPLIRMATIHGPWIIVLDGLDECDGQAEATPTIQIFTLLCEYLNQIPTHIRFFITSRQEPTISSLLVRERVEPLIHVIRIHEQYALSSDADLRRYLTHELQDNVKNGPTLKQDVDTLVKMANGLLSHVFTLTALLQAVRRGEKQRFSRADLVECLIQNSKGYEDSPLHLIYYEFLVDGAARNEGKGHRRVVAAISCLRSTFTVSGLAGLLDLTRKNTRRALDLLRPFIHIPPSDDSEAHLYPQSFRDFLANGLMNVSSNDPIRDDVTLHDQVTGEAELATICLIRMKRGLLQNMIDIKDTLQLHDETPGPNSRLESKIPWSLRYSCLHWVAHLSATAVVHSSALRGEMEEWARTRMLYWLEVLSISEKLSEAIPSLRKAAAWYKECDQPATDVLELLNDGQRFVALFSEPIRAGAQHIYCSALSFTPDSRLTEIYQGQGSVRVVRGKNSRWPSFLWAAQKHSDPVNSVAVSPDGRWIVSGSDDNTIRVWSSDTGQLQHTLEGHSNWVRSVAVSPDGRWIVSGSDDKTIRVWSSDTRQLQHTLEGHSGPIRSVAVSPDGRWIVSGSGDNTIRIWSSDTGQLRHTLEGHSDWVRSVAVSPDGRWIVSGSSDKTVRVWSSNTGQLKHILEGHSHWVTSVVVSPDGQSIISIDENGKARYWAIETGKEATMAPFPGLRIDEDGWVNDQGHALCWVPPDNRPTSPDVQCSHGNLLVLGSRAGIVTILDFSDVLSTIST